VKLQFVASGFRTTTQDLGRPGHTHMGVPIGGGLDRSAMRYANHLVGNALSTPVLEVTLSGPHLSCLEAGRVALVGSGFDLLLNGEPQPALLPISVKHLDQLIIKSSGNGCRAYLSVSGDWHAERWLGSASALRIGSHELVPGAVWTRGDVLETRDRLVKPWPSALLPPQPPSNIIRASPGPEYDWLDDHGRSQLLFKRIRVVDPSNRVGLRTNTQIQLREEKRLIEIVSSGVQPGTVQLTHGGQAIILMRDGQTIGGYPRVLQCASQSLDRLAHLKVGDEFTLSLIDS